MTIILVLDRDNFMKVICWTIALLTLISWGTSRVLHPGNMDFPHQFFLLKYAGNIAFLNFSVLMFSYPFLMAKGFISVNYHDDENEEGKAKTILVIYTIMLPGVVLICVAGILSEIIPFAIIMALFWYVYLKNSYIFFVKKKEPKRGRPR